MRNDLERLATRHTIDTNDAFVVLHLQTGLRLYATPVLNELFLARFREFHLADDRKYRRSRHHELTAREMRNRAAKGILFNGNEIEFGLHRAE